VSAPELVPVPDAPKGCVFDANGLCGLHGNHISEHSAIISHEMMTLEEAKRRYPDHKYFHSSTDTKE
jgi:hypothetical protein